VTLFGDMRSKIAFEINELATEKRAHSENTCRPASNSRALYAHVTFNFVSSIQAFMLCTKSGKAHNPCSLSPLGYYESVNIAVHSQSFACSLLSQLQLWTLLERGDARDFRLTNLKLCPKARASEMFMKRRFQI
jgi:hypothetical protein